MDKEEIIAHVSVMQMLESDFGEVRKEFTLARVRC